MKTMMMITILVLMTTMMAKANPITTWVESEKNKIVEYQTKSWANGKAQLANTKQSILNLFKKKDDTQDELGRFKD